MGHFLLGRCLIAYGQNRKRLACIEFDWDRLVSDGDRHDVQTTFLKAIAGAIRAACATGMTALRILTPSATTAADAAVLGVTAMYPRPPVSVPSEIPPWKIHSAAAAPTIPPPSPIVAASASNNVATWVREKPSARITATSLMRSRTIIAIELAAISSTVISTTLQMLYIIVRTSPIPVITLFRASDSGVVSVWPSES